MDESHGEFIDLMSRLRDASDTQFAPLFHHLLVHTTAHFDFEDELMRQSRFPGLDEHRREHNRVLHQMREFLDRVSAGDSAPDSVYVKQDLPAWFDVHVAGMDSILARHLKEHLF